MMLMVMLGVSLRFVQETRADTAAAKAQGDDQRHRHRRA